MITEKRLLYLTVMLLCALLILSLIAIEKPAPACDNKTMSIMENPLLTPLIITVAVIIGSVAGLGKSKLFTRR